MDQPYFDPTPDGRPPHAGNGCVAADDIEPGDALYRNGKQLHRKGRMPAAPLKITLEIELLPAVYTPGYAPRYLGDVMLNTVAQQVTAKLLTATLIAHGEKLADGLPVKRPDQAIQWLIERLALALPQPTLDELLAAGS